MIDQLEIFSNFPVCYYLTLGLFRSVRCDFQMLHAFPEIPLLGFHLIPWGPGHMLSTVPSFRMSRGTSHVEAKSRGVICVRCVQLCTRSLDRIDCSVDGIVRTRTHDLSLQPVDCRGEGAGDPSRVRGLAGSADACPLVSCARKSGVIVCIFRKNCPFYHYETPCCVSGVTLCPAACSFGVSITFRNRVYILSLSPTFYF